MLCIFRVEYNERVSHFPRPYKKDKVLYTSVVLEGTPIPILDRFFLLTYPLIAPVKSRHAIY